MISEQTLATGIEANEIQDWLTLWQTELAGMAADPDWSARMARFIAALGAARAFWPGHDPAPHSTKARAEAAGAASVAERLADIERRLAALEPTPG